MEAALTRRAAVAGQFYPGDPMRLRTVVRDHMAASGVAPAPDATAVIIAPHAGYPYSGPTAGYAYRRIQGKAPKRVVLLGVSHRYALDKASVYSAGSFETPVGTFPVDSEFAGALAKETDSPGVEPHRLEHSLEVQLPFLEAAVGAVPIAPVLFGAPPLEWHAQFGQTLAAMVDKDDLLVISTDLSHFLGEEDANTIDQASIQAVLAGDWARFAQGACDGRFSMCGAAAVTAGMSYALAQGADRWRLLDYRTSARATGDRSRVVGYAALSMEWP